MYMCIILLCGQTHRVRCYHVIYGVYLIIGYRGRGQHCQQPYGGYGHVHRTPFVLRGPADDHPVPVDGDHRDRAHRHHDVGALEQGYQFAEHRAHGPLMSQNRRQRERHAHQAQRHVGYGQVHYVQVSGGVHLSASGHHVDHGQVGGQTDRHQSKVHDYQ